MDPSSPTSNIQDQDLMSSQKNNDMTDSSAARNPNCGGISSIGERVRPGHAVYPDSAMPLLGIFYRQRSFFYSSTAQMAV